MNMIVKILLHHRWNNGQYLVKLFIMYNMIGILEIFYSLDIKAIDQKYHRKIYDRLKEEDRQVIEIGFGDTPDRLKGEYLDMYK